MTDTDLSTGRELSLCTLAQSDTDTRAVSRNEPPDILVQRVSQIHRMMAARLTSSA